MNALSAARKHHKEKKHAALAKKAEETAVKKGKFGDRAFDHMNAGKHDFRHPESCKEGHIPCSFCRIINLQTERFFKFEKDRAYHTRKQSMIKRAEMRFNLLQCWARNQVSYFDDAIPSNFKHQFSSEISISEDMVDSLVEEAAFRELVEGKEYLWGLSSESENDKGEIQAIDMNEIIKILERRKRLLEVGHYAAVFLQSRIRKMSARKRVRAYAMKRFEFIPAGVTRPDTFVDRNTGSSSRDQPMLLSDMKMNTPRTMSRRVNALENAREKRLKTYQKYITHFIDKDTGDFYDLFEMEEKRMTRMRNFIVLRDILAVAMSTITRQLRVLRAEEAGISLDESSEEEEEEEEDREEADNETTTTTNGGKESLEDGGSTVTAKDLASLTSMEHHLFVPVYFSLAAPSPASRELGLIFALATPTVRKKKQGHSAQDISSVEMNQIMIAMEMRAWKCLKATKPEDIVNRLVNENAHPPLQSCVAIADDDQDIWRGDSKLKFDGDSVAIDAKYRMQSKKEKARNADERMMEQTEENINKGHVLPTSIYLRPVIHECGPKDVFRLFFVDGELVGATAYSPWAYFSDTFKLRDQVVEAVKDFATSPDIRNFIHSYCNRANRALLKACGVLNKQGFIDFDLLDAESEYEIPQDADSADPNNTRRISTLNGLPGLNKRQSIQPGSAMQRRISTLQDPNDRKMSTLGDRKTSMVGQRSQSIVGDRSKSVAVNKKASISMERQFKDEHMKNKQAARNTQLYVPSEKFLYQQMPYIYKPTLTSQEIVNCTEKYPFLKKSSAWKPGLVKAQNEVFRNAGKSKKASTIAKPKQIVRQLHASRLRVLNDIPEPNELLGSTIFEKMMIDVPGGLEKTDENMERYFTALGQMTIHTEVPIIDRILRPKLQDIGDPPEYTEDKSNKRGDKGEEAKVSHENAKSEEEKREERRKKELEHSLNLELPPLNLFVMEAVLATDANMIKKKKKKKDDKKQTEKAAEDNQKPVTQKLKMDMHQVIGIFSCDREVNERAPPAVDCGLLPWDHFLDMNDVAAYEKEVHPLQWLSRPAPANYILPLDKGTRPWSHPGPPGVITHEVKLVSKKKFMMSIIGVAPDKDYLQKTIPRNIKTWLGF